MTAAHLKRLWIKLHRWVGLSLGALLLFSGLTGTLLILGEPIDEALRPHLFQADRPGDGKLDPVLARLRQAHGPDAAFTFRPPREPGETLQVFVTGPWNGTVYIDPHSGEERGRLGDTEGAFNLLFALHSTLLAEQTGRAILALAALAYVLLLATGVVLWWPRRWRQALTVQVRFGWARTLYDMHRVAGVTLGLVVLVTVLSGAYMAWRPLSMAVSALASERPTPMPTLSAPLSEAPASVDNAVALARAWQPDAMVGYVQVPGRGQLQPVRIRLRTPDDPHPNGLSSMWVHPVTGAVMVRAHWASLDAGTRAYSWIYPLHVGELGGTMTWWITLGSGVALVMFGFSGMWLWWQRRPSRRR